MAFQRTFKCRSKSTFKVTVDTDNQSLSKSADLESITSSYQDRPKSRPKESKIKHKQRDVTHKCSSPSPNPRTITISPLSDFKHKITECEKTLKFFDQLTIETEGSSIPIAINLALQIKLQYQLLVSVCTGSKYIGEQDSQIKEYHNVPSIKIVLTKKPKVTV